MLPKAINESDLSETGGIPKKRAKRSATTLVLPLHPTVITTLESSPPTNGTVNEELVEDDDPAQNVPADSNTTEVSFVEGSPHVIPQLDSFSAQLVVVDDAG